MLGRVAAYLRDVAAAAELEKRSAGQSERFSWSDWAQSAAGCVSPGRGSGGFVVRGQRPVEGGATDTEVTGDRRDRLVGVLCRNVDEDVTTCTCRPSRPYRPPAGRLGPRHRPTRRRRVPRLRTHHRQVPPAPVRRRALAAQLAHRRAEGSGTRGHLFVNYQGPALAASERTLTELILRTCRRIGVHPHWLHRGACHRPQPRTASRPRSRSRHRGPAARHRRRQPRSHEDRGFLRGPVRSRTGPRLQRPEQPPPPLARRRPANERSPLPRRSSRGRRPPGIHRSRGRRWWTAP